MGQIGWLLLIILGPPAYSEEHPGCRCDGMAGQMPLAEFSDAALRADRGYGREAIARATAGDAEASAVGSETGWRRTRDGWERPSRWTYRRRSRPPALHPIVVGLLETFLALAALLAFSETGDRKPRPKPNSAWRPGRHLR